MLRVIGNSEGWGRIMEGKKAVVSRCLSKGFSDEGLLEGNVHSS